MRPLLLTSRNVEHYSAAFFLRNSPSDALPQNALLISRKRFVGGGMQEHLAVRNQTAEPVAFMLALELEADFADIITVKEHELAGGATAGLRPLPPPGGRRFEEDRKELFFSEGERGAMAETQIVLSRAAELDGDLLWLARRAGTARELGAPPRHRGALRRRPPIDPAANSS